jgi:hypothetical protein
MDQVDVQIRLMWRGAIAGLIGGIIGATCSAFVYGLSGYSLIGYLFWIIITVILGMTFTFIVGAIQRMNPTLHLVIRAVVGGIIGIATAWAWVSVVRTNVGSASNTFGKGIVMMIISTGILSGILAGPVKNRI